MKLTLFILTLTPLTTATAVLNLADCDKHITPTPTTIIGNRWNLPVMTNILPECETCMYTMNQNLQVNMLSRLEQWSIANA
jgi:hypothetical protein